MWQKHMGTVPQRYIDPQSLDGDMYPLYLYAVFFCWETVWFSTSADCFIHLLKKEFCQPII